MIRVMLIDMRGEKSYIECHRVPQGSDGISMCKMTGIIPAEYAKEVARDVAQGYMSGFTAGYHWYRQAGSPITESIRGCNLQSDNDEGQLSEEMKINA